MELAARGGSGGDRRTFYSLDLQEAMASDLGIPGHNFLVVLLGEGEGQCIRCASTVASVIDVASASVATSCRLEGRPSGLRLQPAEGSRAPVIHFKTLVIGGGGDFELTGAVETTMGPHGPWFTCNFVNVPYDASSK